MSDGGSARSEGSVEVNGVPHFCRMIGGGEPFMVLHGGPDMWHDELLPFFGDLSRDHQVVFYDQRGNGTSLMPEITAEHFTVGCLVSDLEELRNAWGFDRFGIIGHSWDGLLAMYSATRYPERVERLVLVDAAPANTDLLRQSYQVLIGRFADADKNRLEEIYESDAYLESAAACCGVVGFTATLDPRLNRDRVMWMAFRTGSSVTPFGW